MSGSDPVQVEIIRSGPILVEIRKKNLFPVQFLLKVLQVWFWSRYIFENYIRVRSGPVTETSGLVWLHIWVPVQGCGSNVALFLYMTSLG